MSKRDAQILELLTSEKKIEVSALAEHFGVSTVTMRKDLDSLQTRGLALREHGFALLSNPNDVAGRLAYHYEEKLRIAKRAAESVSDGATIMIESGSCCALLARELADTHQGVTIITNSVFISTYVRDSPNITTVLLGGTVQGDSQVTVGPLLRSCVTSFAVERLFIGADGWLDGIGFTNGDQFRAEAVLSMAESAAQVVVLTESEKFHQYEAVPLRFENKPLYLVTDAGISPADRRKVKKLGIHIALA